MKAMNYQSGGMKTMNYQFKSKQKHPVYGILYVIFLLNLFSVAAAADIDYSGNLFLAHMDELSANSAPGGTDVEDFSGNGYHGTEYGGVTFGVPGKFATALSFDGVNDYIKTGVDYDFAGHSEMTLSMWIKPNRDYTEETARSVFAHKGYGSPFELAFDKGSDSN